eukprot:CAMPEP_0172590216 /NCGR_PEP_ID=MMETSP1068-20121228/8649_1 /TAXON_ID=35684 /ORGANISM="Pseudopedinella elastica, Strain CCMP716" /LENGTH=125 /DNA_ID=CAMNT_0013385949 /DNA_START=90 /DNA_END=467 /DNA_ORIENTATION=+
MKFSFLAVGAALFAGVAEAFQARPTFTRAVSAPITRVPPLNDVMVTAGDNEPVESILRRFKREVNSSGHLMELRHRRYFENSQDIKKRKIKEARRRVKMERLSKRRNNRFRNMNGPGPKPAAEAK